ncbi:MAG TPA: DinB family protein [Chitinophagaceae bacterium]|nr:DinB family protein [Chitinophagaceae bacterium]
MNNPFENIRKVRAHLLGYIEGLTTEQINKIPTGFNNNIAWNLAHLVASQQGICYVRSGLETVVDKAFVEAYLPGTKPEKDLSTAEIETVRRLLISTVDRFEEDYQNKRFAKYTPATVRYGITLSNIEDALQFLPFHEGLHTGYIWALKRAVTAV